MQIDALVEKQLERLYKDIREDGERSLAIRKWCITVWTATQLITAKVVTLPTHTDHFIFLPYISIFLFLLIDAFECSFVVGCGSFETTAVD